MMQLVTGLLSSLLGIVVIIGWVFNVPTLVQILPDYVPMQFNTAIGFLLCGGALLLSRFKQYSYGYLCGFIVAMLGFFTILQYGYGWEFGIDELFIKHYININSSSPGRMAPNTALCFILSGLALGLIHSYKNRSRLGIVVLTLGGLSTIGYIFDLVELYGWGKMTEMALHTSLGFIAVGVGINSFRLDEK